MSNHPKVDALRKDAATVAIISKLVDEPRRQGRAAHRGDMVPPNDALLNKVSMITSNNVTDAKSIFQLLPEMELTKQILIASIISPNNMVSTDINFSIADNTFDTELATPLLRVITDFFENDYKIKKQLPLMLEDILFYRGSYPVAVLPESTIDEAINSHQRVTLESVRELLDDNGNIHSVGVLGNSSHDAKVKAPDPDRAVSLESLMQLGKVSTQAYNPAVGNGSIGLTVVDDPNILKMPMLRSRVIHERVMTKYKVRSLGMEARKEFSSPEEIRKMENVLYRPRSYNYTPAQALVSPGKSAKNTQGHPLVMLLPSESIIPAHVPGDNTKHVGYFVLLDSQGNPLSTASRTDYYSDLVNSLAIKPEQVQQMLQTNFPAATSGRFEGENKGEMQELNRTYASIVEQDLLMRLRNGIYGDSVEITHRDEIFRIMMARSMAKKQTQLLFIPVELMVYMAFDYNEYGVGKSLVEDTKILASLRIMMLFANTMAGIKNSVGRTGLEITLDPDDRDPSGTVETMLNEYAHTRQMAYPIGTAAPLEIIQFLQRAAVDVHVTGNPMYPETRAEVVDKQSNKTTVDTTLADDLKKSHIMSFGIAPETVDLGMNVEFATSIVSSNILLAKRSKIYQDKICGFIEELVHKITVYSETLMHELRGIVSENKTAIPQYIKDMTNGNVDPDLVITEFLRAVRVKLPEADSVKLENQSSAYEIYKTTLDSCLEAYLNQDFLTGTELGKNEAEIAQVIAAIRAHFLRQWQRNNNMLPELTAMISQDEKDEPILDLLDTHKNFVDAINKSVGTYLLSVRENTIINDKSMDDGEAKLEQKYSVDPTELEDDETNSGGSNEEDNNGTDDFGFDDEDTSGDTDTEVEGETEEPATDESEGEAVAEEEEEETPEDENPEEPTA